MLLLLLLLLVMYNLLLVGKGGLGSRSCGILLLKGGCIGNLLLGANCGCVQCQLIHQRCLLLLLLSCSELRLRLLLLLRLLIGCDELLLVMYPSCGRTIRGIVAVLLMLLVLLNTLVNAW